MKTQKCKVCFRSHLTKDEIGINMKLLGPDIKAFFCIDCLANYF